MERSKRRVKYAAGSSTVYTAYGMNGGGRGRKRKGLSERLRLLLVLAALAFIIGVSVSYALRSTGREHIGGVTRIGATLSQNVMPFGDSVIFYDGTTLHCVAASGGNKWSYQIGTNADYDATEERIVAWSGNDLFILNNRGRLIYNNTMTDTVQFASAGTGYVAAFVGQPDNGVITVVDQNGQIVDNIAIENQTLLDIGFFFSETSSGAQQVELMWVLGLDTTGTVISTELQTFQPGRLSTGKSSLGEHIAYSVYYADGVLNVVDTRQITRYNYRVIEEGTPTLIYGYTVEDVKTLGGTTYQLLIPEQETSEGISISNVRLMAGSSDRMLHLPGECIACKLGSRSVYGFSENAVYVCKLNETTFQAHALPVNITAVLGMISDDRAVVASGSEIYVVELPL